MQRMNKSGTTTGLAGSDVLAEQMNPDIELSATADPSDVVEVTPEHLVNRNAFDSTRLEIKRANYDGSQGTRVVRRNAAS